MEKTFNKILDKNLTKYYNTIGYFNNKEWFIFEKNGFEILFLQTRKDIGKITYCPQFRIYIEPVTKILNKIFPENIINPCSVHNTGAGMAQTLNNYEYDSTKHNNYGSFDFTRYEVMNEVELLEIFEEHKIYVNNVVFPYFKKYATLESAYKFIYEILMEGEQDEYLSQKRQKELLNQIGTREIYSTIVIGNELKLIENGKLLRRLKSKYSKTKIWEKIERINSFFNLKNDDA